MAPESFLMVILYCLLLSFATGAAFLFVAWLIQLVTKNAAIVDVAWCLGIVASSMMFFVSMPSQLNIFKV